MSFCVKVSDAPTTPHLPEAQPAVKRRWPFTGLVDPDDAPALEERALTVPDLPLVQAAMFKDVLANPEEPESTKVLDFVDHVVDVATAEGHLCNLDDEFREITVLGYVPLDVPTEIVHWCLEMSSIDPRAGSDGLRRSRSTPT